MVDPWKIPVEFTGTRDHNCDIHARLKLADAMPQPVLEQMAAAAEAEAAQAEAAQPEPGYPRTILLRYHACSEQGGDVSGTREAVLKTCEVDIEGELNRITLELRGQGLRLIRYESADDSFDLGAMVRAVAAAVPPEVYPRIFSIRYQAEKLDGKIVMGISDVVLQHCEAEIALAVERIKENLKARELTNIRFEAEDPEIDLDAMLMRAGARGLVKEYRNESPVDDAAGQPPLGSEMTMQIGLVMFERGDYKSAIPNFHLVQKDPEAKGRALYWEARCWFMLEQYDIAYERLTAALADDKIDRDTKHDAAVKFDSVKRLLEQRALKSDQEPLAPETPPNFGGDPVHEPGNPKTE
jgi:tetratricopeptide (TPR) repeat protein